jgi:hypothetical protein
MLWGSSNKLPPFAGAAQLPVTSCYPHCAPAAAAGQAPHCNLLTNQQQQQMQLQPMQMQQQMQSAGVGELDSAVDGFLEALPGLDTHDVFDETDELLAHLLDLPPLPCLQRQQEQQQQQQQLSVPPLPHSNAKAELCLTDLLLMP